MASAVVHSPVASETSSLIVGKYGLEADYRAFNALPHLDESKVALAGLKGESGDAGALHSKLADVGRILVKSGRSDALCVCLTHMHYPVGAGEVQVFCCDDSVAAEAGMDGASVKRAYSVSVESHMAKPRPAKAFLSRIPYKWYLSEDSDDLIAYEFYAATVPNAEYYRREARKLADDDALRRSLARALRATGAGKFLGIALRFRACDSEGAPVTHTTAFELNDVAAKESRFVVLRGDKEDIDRVAESVDEIADHKDDAIETGWAFAAADADTESGEDDADADVIDGVMCAVCVCIHSDC